MKATIENPFKFNSHKKTASIVFMASFQAANFTAALSNLPSIFQASVSRKIFKD